MKNILNFIVDWETIKSYILALGMTKGLFAMFFVIMHVWIYLLYRGRIQDRQNEINRIAAENREYRDRFLSLLDKHFSYDPDERNKKKLEGEKGKGRKEG